MLQRLHIKGFKSLADVEVGLAPLTVVFGPNAAGKSNLLESMLLLSRLISSRTISDAFSPPIRGYPAECFQLGRGGLAELVGSGPRFMEVEGDIQTSSSVAGAGDLFRYRVRIRYEPATGEFSLDDEFLASLRARTRAVARAYIGRETGGAPSENGVESERRLTLKRGQGAGRPREYFTGQRFTIVSDQRFGGDEWPVNEAVRSEATLWRVYYLDPREAMRVARPPRDAQDIGPAGADLAPYLYRLKIDPRERGRFDAVRRMLTDAIPSIESLDVDLDERRGELDIQVKQDGITLSSRVISEGTLRVLALCALAADTSSGGLVAFEEPENGVPADRLDVLLGIVDSVVQHRNRQVVLTTHSPAVVAEILQRRRAGRNDVGLLLCRRERNATVVTPFDVDAGLFSDDQIREGLRDDDAGLVTAMMRRGWFNG